MPRWPLIDQFLQSARANDVAGLESLSKAHPLLVNALDRRGWNALASAGGKEATAWLLDHGAVSPPEARRQADAAFMRYVEFRPGFAAWSNLQRAREHVDFYDANLNLVANHHQSTNTTILHMALASPEMTAFVLDLGADELLEARTGPGEEGREAGLTPLQMAARRGYEATARLLIERGAVFDVFTAAVIDDLERLSACSDDELGTVDHYGASPLHWAAMYGGAETVSLLLDRGLAIDDENDFGETPLALAGLAPGHDMPAQTDRTAVIELLRRRGAKVDVFSAAALGDNEALSALLDADTGLARATNRFDSTPLHYAAWAGHADAARQLLERGADVDAFDRHGMPPLIYAAYWGRHENTVEMLLENGADVYWKNIWGKGQSAYDAIFDHNHWLARKGGSATHEAALTGDVSRLRGLLEDSPARVGERSQSSATPLHAAASGNQVEAIRLLLDAGADIEAKMDRGISPLYSAARAGAAEAVALLIARGADVMSTGTAWQAWTPLHGTTRRRGDRVKVAEMLLDAGADVDWASPWGGITPMYATVIEADVDKAQLLIARGADVNHKITIWQKDSLLHTVANRPEIPVAGAVAMIELLVASGADVHALDDAGHTPLQVAVHAKCAEALRRHGGA